MKIRLSPPELVFSFAVFVSVVRKARLYISPDSYCQTTGWRGLQGAEHLEHSREVVLRSPAPAGAHWGFLEGSRLNNPPWMRSRSVSLGTRATKRCAMNGAGWKQKSLQIRISGTWKNDKGS